MDAPDLDRPPVDPEPEAGEPSAVAAPAVVAWVSVAGRPRNLWLEALVITLLVVGVLALAATVGDPPAPTRG
jgi:hypothetical protein